MEKIYDPQAIETRWYETWEQRGYFRPGGKGRPYCIALPPPNVTGSLHMGHAFQQTLMDVLIRYHRMRGADTLWQCGVDHAGIATQMVVERQLESNGQSRVELGRERFIRAVWDWKRHSGDTITRQSRRLGAAMDWSRERFTMDEGLSRAVQEVFIRLYDEGLIYRGKKLVNWDPALHTAISDLEVLAEEENGHLWHIRYPRCDGKGHVVVATTRPETLPGDAAVAVNPADERYRDLVGLQLELPLTGRAIPVIADEYVDPEFGSGCVKITPAHDFNDYEVGARHRLPLLNVFTIDAEMNENAPSAYQGMDRYTARRRIVRDLEAGSLVEAIEEHKIMVPRGDRSGVAIEPYLTDQWYVRVEPLAQPAIAAVENGDVRFIPGHWAKTYFEWMRNIKDWCISRQLWWGHRVPAWYDAQGDVYVGRDLAHVREKYRLGPDVALTRDPDVLDTWFSSALWPFSTLGWPESTSELARFYPTSALVTGFDIIFFWVARMIMMGLKFMDQVPFRDVYITGLVRDSEGRKMSKSKGNVLDPLDLIDGITLEALLKKQTDALMQTRLKKQVEAATRDNFPDGIAAFGTDALRFTFAQLATQGRDIRFDTGRIHGYRNFCNKLWNAARYVLMNVEQQALDLNGGTPEPGVAERWLNTRQKQLIQRVERAIADYRFDLAAQALYEFTWDEYCDWYVELSKTTLHDPSVTRARALGVLQTLLGSLERLLRLLHPFIPFITEELWQRIAPALGRRGASIMLQPYPAAADLSEDPAAVAEIDWLKSVILGVRRIRSERNIPPARPLAIQVMGGGGQARAWLDGNRGYIRALAGVADVVEAVQPPDDAVTARVGDMAIFIPLADLIEPEREIERLRKRLLSLSRDVERLGAKLENQDFVRRAPQQIVQRERDKLAEANVAVAGLNEQLERAERLLQKRHV